MADQTIPASATQILDQVRMLVVEFAAEEKLAGAEAEPGPMASLVGRLSQLKGLSEHVDQSAREHKGEPDGIRHKNHDERAKAYERAIRMLLRSKPEGLDADVVRAYLTVDTGAEARATRRGLLATAGLAFLVFAFPASSPEFSGFGAEISGGPVLVGAFLLVISFQTAALYLESQTAVIDHDGAMRKMAGLVERVETTRSVLEEFQKSFPTFWEDVAQWTAVADAELTTHSGRKSLVAVKRFWAFRLPYLVALLVLLFGVYRLVDGWPTPAPPTSFEEQAVEELRGINRALADGASEKELIDAVRSLQAELAGLNIGHHDEDGGPQIGDGEAPAALGGSSETHPPPADPQPAARVETQEEGVRQDGVDGARPPTIRTGQEGSSVPTPVSE